MKLELYTQKKNQKWRKWVGSLKDNLTKLTQGEIDNMNTPLSTKDIESMMNGLLEIKKKENRALGQYGLFD